VDLTVTTYPADAADLGAVQILQDVRRPPATVESLMLTG
jgi:hypothetical protein